MVAFGVAGAPTSLEQMDGAPQSIESSTITSGSSVFIEFLQHGEYVDGQG
jgi:hypothetical protein